ncbi:hypothetical protein [Lacrimispora amygdalina]|uniref:hypothetical protein n=1 Tax=Lacrimispora amygdalina TaxID=253257 RepID=UPI000BE2E583|nr:hypothetical protein [Lacrimispora amygdalina]
MNYIAEINSFWDSIILNPLSTGQVALWFGLMHINNKCNWTEWFTVSNQVLSIHTGLSRSGILKARNELKQRGLIDFRERGTKATSYKMVTISNSTQDGTQNSVEVSTQNGKQDSTQNSTTLDKQKFKQKLKQKQKGATKVSTRKYSEDVELNDAILAFIAFRLDIKSAMTDHAIDLMLKKLEEMAPGDSPAKIAILNQSIMNGWKGVFPLGDKSVKKSGSTGKQNQFQDFPQRNIDYDAIVNAQLQEM